MVQLRVLARVVGVSQLALGVGILFLPDLFFQTFGFSPANPDQKYLFGQLAARFFAYGIGMFYIAGSLEKNWFWWDMMILIQCIDLAVGLWYSLLGGVPWSVTGFPLFNALVFAVLLAWGRVNQRPEACQ